MEDMEISYAFTTYPRSILQASSRQILHKKSVSFNDTIYFAYEPKQWHKELQESRKNNFLQRIADQHRYAALLNPILESSHRHFVYNRNLG